MTYHSFLRQKQQEALSLGKEDSAALFYLMHVSNLTSSELYARMTEICSEEVIEAFHVGFNRYLKEDYPIQYLIGTQSFFGYDFIVNEEVLIPRFETEELVEQILFLYDEYFAGQEIEIVDIGTGSGCIGVTLALEEPNMKVTITDISEGALRVAKENSERLGAAITVLQGDMLAPIKNQKFDIIVSNPPYIPDQEHVDNLVKKNEPNIALFGGEDGLYFYRRIMENCGENLKERAILGFEHAYHHHQALSDLIHAYFPNATVISKKDMQGKDRMTFALIGLK